MHDLAFAAESARTWRNPENPFPPEKLIGYVLDQPPLFDVPERVTEGGTDRRRHTRGFVRVRRGHRPQQPQWGNTGARGWIPGYSSSLRHDARHGVTAAFQINTDIGMLTGDTPVVRVMEQRLLETVLSALKPPSRSCWKPLMAPHSYKAVNTV